MIVSRFPVVTVAVSLALSACSVAPAGVGIHDPYEAANRQVHEFNKGVDQALLRPAGQAAVAVPEAIRIPVANFSDNAGLPRAVFNNVLQGDIGGAMQNTLRFVVNSTVGFLGLADPAGAIGLTEVEADFGQILAVWGVAEGAYLELPLLGPSTERDALGQLVDFAISPLDGLGLNRALGDGAMARYDTAARIADIIISRGNFGGTLDSIIYESADGYAQTRLLYLQNRRFELGEAGQSGYPGGGGDTVMIDPYADAAYIDPYEDNQ